MRGGYAVVDLETTGKHPGWHHRVVEIGVVLLDGHGESIDEWNTLVNPGRDLGPQYIHGITGAQVRRAPTFEAIAGELAARLSGNVLVTHNLSFDLRFLLAEFRRMGIEIPIGYTSGLCTMRLAQRYLPGAGRSLTGCCEASGISLQNAHSALYDARAAAALFGTYLAREGKPVPWSELITRAARKPWPSLPTGLAEPVVREQAHQQERHFLARLVDCLPSVPDQPGADDYLAVLDAALIDRHLSDSEQDELLAVANDVDLTFEQVMNLHRGYLLELARAAWRDGVVTDDERSDLVATAHLLGLDVSESEGMLEQARHEVGSGSGVGGTARWGTFSLVPGDLVVFTGQMELSRDEWHQRAVRAGMRVNGGTITRHTRLLIAADPDSPSGKARKARELRVPIVTESRFAELLDELQTTHAAGAHVR